jgi:uncharacterized membrane protein
MTHSITTRAQSLVLTGAVLTTLLLVASRTTVSSVDPGACRAVASDTSAATLASLGSGDCASGSSPIGYRMP